MSNEKSPTPAAPAGKPRRVKIILLMVLLCGATVAGRMWWHGRNFEETDNAYLAGHVSTISSRVPGVITKVLVSDNQVVQKGDVLAELDHADQQVRVAQIKAQLAQIDAQAKQGEAQIEQARAEAQAVSAQLSRSQTQLKRASTDADRYSSLYNSQMKAIAKTELDAAVAARDSAAADVKALSQQVHAAESKIDVSEHSRSALLAQKNVLATQLEDAKLQLSYHTIVAPVAGRIGRKNLEVGIRVQSGQQLLSIVQEGGWVTANFKETQIAPLFRGQKATIRIDAFPGRDFIGHVESFSPASGAQFSLMPPDNATGNFTKIVQRVPVKIVFDPKDLKTLEGRLTPGMSAFVEIDLRQGGPAERPVAVAAK
jgi:membrane fusion protein (multidrug efflux system)